MKKILLLAAIVVVVLFAAAAWLAWGPAKVPAGQPPLVTLAPENFAQFQAVFNSDSDKVRAVALLSPT